MEILENLSKIKKNPIHFFIITDAKEKKNKNNINNMVFNKIEENGFNTKPKRKIVEIGYNTVINFIEITLYEHLAHGEQAVRKGHLVDPFKLGHLYNIAIFIFYCLSIFVEFVNEKIAIFNKTL